jgi:beta-glucanase (GH16 family)
LFEIPLFNEGELSMKRVNKEKISTFRMLLLLIILFFSFCSVSYALRSVENQEKVSATPNIKLSVPNTSPSSQCTKLAKGTVLPNELVGLQRTFFDDFNKLDLSAKGWSPFFDGGFDEDTQTWLGYDNPNKRTLKGNKEQQIYVDQEYKGTSEESLNLNPFFLKDGVLNIVAQRTPASLKKSLYGYQYYSGLITTRKSFVQRYGYFEMRAKLPEGKALWPAFWLLPFDKSWPPELDIVELVGQQPDLIVTTAHWGESLQNYQSSGCRTQLTTATKNFHLYGAYWQPKKVTFYIDRQAIAEIATPVAMNKPMYMLLNLAVGGKMVGVADDETPLPAKFEIDWVAAYQSKELGAIK